MGIDCSLFIWRGDDLFEYPLDRWHVFQDIYLINVDSAEGKLPAIEAYAQVARALGYETTDYEQFWMLKVLKVITRFATEHDWEFKAAIISESTWGMEYPFWKDAIRLYKEDDQPAL